MSSDETAARLPAEMIGKKRRRAAALRDAYYRKAIDQDVSDVLMKELASVSLEYWSILREFRNEPAVDADDFPDVEPIRSRLGRETEIIVESPRRGGDETTKRVPAVQELNAEYLIGVTHALDDLSQKLGFGASATQEVEVFGVAADATGGDAP